MDRVRSRWKLAGVVFVFLWFFIGGIAHFVATQTEMRIRPWHGVWIEFCSGRSGAC